MPEPDPAYVLPLTAVDRHSLSVAGGKGANLGELIRAGFAVPEGFVVSTRLYRDALQSAGGAVSGAGGHSDAAVAVGIADGRAGSKVDPKRLQAATRAMTIPPGAAAEIVAAFRELGEGPVAVRSSATSEDLPGAAFAGQHYTFLNVVGSEAVLAAVRDCWASLWSARAMGYRARIGGGAAGDVAGSVVGSVIGTVAARAPEMAVVVQRMVQSEFAGVMFTANPVTGARDEVVIQASPGLGEAVVSGSVTPEQVVIDRGGRIRERRAGRREVIIRGRRSGGVVTDEGSGDHAELPARVLTELAAVGEQIARHFAREQDIEWAHADGATWVVQARPLTALPPAPVKANRIRRVAAATCAELVPSRPYPLDITAWTIPGWFNIPARMAADLPAVRIDVERMFPETDGVVQELLPPKLRPTARTLTTPARVRNLARRYRPARWTADPRFLDYQRRIQQLRRQDHTAVSWPDLMMVPGTGLKLLDDFVALRIDYLPAVMTGLVRLRALLAVLGLSSQFWPLLAGQPSRTRAGNDALQAMAEQIRRTPAWAAAFGTLDDDALAAAVRRDCEFEPLRADIGEWLDAFGHRETTSAALVSAPSWDEDPKLLLGHLRGLIAQPAATAEESGRSDLVLRAIVGRRRVRFSRTAGPIARAVAAARAGMVFREDSHFHALRVRPVLRSALLEAGNRLVSADVLADPEDVFHLRLDEIRRLEEPSGLGPEERQRLRQLVRQRSVRRAEYAGAPLISPLTLHPEPRRPAPDALASGSPGGGGRAAGAVRVIREPSEFGRLRPGEILVCPYTNPAWTPLFQMAAAVVADSGSFGSHAAIVAREYGIPAVMGTGNGTRVLRDGLRVLVDGDRGDVLAEQRDLHG
jgi:phosphohistidine swiveling domain-containing protein